MYSLLELLPQLLTQLNRRKAAFVTECLLPIVKLARVSTWDTDWWRLRHSDMMDTSTISIFVDAVNT